MVYIFVSILMVSYTYSMESQVADEKSKNIEMIPLISGEKEKIVFLDGHKYCIKGSARLTKCTFPVNSVLTIPKRRVLTLIGCQCSKIYLEPQATLQLFDGTTVGKTVQAPTAIIMKDETSFVMASHEWEKFSIQDGMVTVSTYSTPDIKGMYPEIKFKMAQ